MSDPVRRRDTIVTFLLAILVVATFFGAYAYFNLTIGGTR